MEEGAGVGGWSSEVFANARKMNFIPLAGYGALGLDVEGKSKQDEDDQAFEFHAMKFTG
jgi:hypothetical protein